MSHASHDAGSVAPLAGIDPQAFGQADVCDCPVCRSGEPHPTPVDEMARPVRRRVRMIAKIDADDWEILRAELLHLAWMIARHGKLSRSSISGGYSCGHIIVAGEDDAIDHDSWAIEINAYLDRLAARERAAATPSAVIPGRDAVASPGSITPVSAGAADAVAMDSGLAPQGGAPRNDERVIAGARAC